LNRGEKYIGYVTGAEGWGISPALKRTATPCFILMLNNDPAGRG
jgi:hypothetical protein